MIRKFLFAFAILLAFCPKAMAQDEAMPTPLQEPQQALTANLAVPLGDVVREDSTTWVGRLQAQLDTLCQDRLFETSHLGMCVYDLTDNRLLYTKNQRQLMRPASNQKLVTAITALTALGADYEFSTRVCTTGKIEDGILKGNLYIIGGMDPMLSRDDLDNLARTLHEAGIDSIAGLICADLSAKDDKEFGNGWCWDDEDGPLSVLLLNKKAGIEMPLLDRFEKAGIRMECPALIKENCPKDARLLTVIKHPLGQLLDPMMKDSDNMLAECLFYQLAFQSGKQSAGASEAATVIILLMTKLGISAESYDIADGSGLSLYNFITPEALLTLLNYAYRHPEIYAPLSVTLPIAGVDGTLKKRMISTPAMGNVYAKTGTVTSVSSLSGYAMGGNGHLLSFSIINQGIKRAAQGRDFQDKVCCVLCKE